MKKVLFYGLAGLMCLTLAVIVTSKSLFGQAMSESPASCMGFPCGQRGGLDVGDYNPGGGKPVVCCEKTYSIGRLDLSIPD